MYRSTMLAAAVFAAMAATPVAAQAHEQRLTYADLNLNSAAGAEAFNSRVRNAARQACGERFGRIGLREYMQVRDCKRAFIEDVRVRLASA